MQTLGIENKNFQHYQCSLVLWEELTGRIQMKVQMKIQIHTQIQIQADEKSWRWPQSGNELNEPAGEQWRPLGADLATGFASTIARIKIHKQIQNTFEKKYLSKYTNKWKLENVSKSTYAEHTNKYRKILQRSVENIKKQKEQNHTKLHIHQNTKKWQTSKQNTKLKNNCNY